MQEYICSETGNHHAIIWIVAIFLFFLIAGAFIFFIFYFSSWFGAGRAAGNGAMGLGAGLFGAGLNNGKVDTSVINLPDNMDESDISEAFGDGIHSETSGKKI